MQETGRVLHQLKLVICAMSGQIIQPEYDGCIQIPKVASLRLLNVMQFHVSTHPTEAVFTPTPP